MTDRPSERPFALEVNHAGEGDCPVCFYGDARRCRSRWHRQVLSAVSPQPDPRLHALPEPYTAGSFRVLEVRSRELGAHVRHAAVCWHLENHICRGTPDRVSMYPQHRRFLLISPDDRPVGAAVVSRWRSEPHELEWLWVAPDYRSYSHLLRHGLGLTFRELAEPGNGGVEDPCGICGANP